MSYTLNFCTICYYISIKLENIKYNKLFILKSNPGFLLKNRLDMTRAESKDPN